MRKVSVHIQLLGWLKESIKGDLEQLRVSENVEPALSEIINAVRQLDRSPIEDVDLNILINNRNAKEFFKENQTLKDGDRITILPVVGGG